MRIKLLRTSAVAFILFANASAHSLDAAGADVDVALAMAVGTRTAATAEGTHASAAESGPQKAPEPVPASKGTGDAKKLAAEPISNSQPAKYDKVISGRVVDEKDNPVAGAEWYMAPKLGYNRTERWKLRGIADASGRFVIRVPAKWLEQQRFVPRWLVWAYSPGYQLKAVSAHALIFKKSTEELKIALAPATDTSFVILDPDGTPLPGAVVEPWHVRFNSSYDIVPEDLSRLVRGMTDSSGRAKLPAVPLKGFLTVQVRGPRVRFPTFGTQQVPLDPSGDTPAERTIRLRPTGRVEGRLVGDNRESVRGVWLAVTSGEYSQAGSGILLPRGFTEVATDDDGRFVVPETVAGSLYISFAMNPQSHKRPLVPENLSVAAGETARVEVPLAPAVQVRGEVKTSQTGDGVAGVLVSIGHESVRTDAQGKFQVYVLPGSVNVQTIAVPNGFRHLEPLSGKNAITIPSTKEPFDLPPLVIAKSETIQDR
jgi:hypothetical protein